MLGLRDFALAMARGPIHPESKEALAERLVLIRTVKGWTQAVAAHRIGEKQATWGYWESFYSPRKPTRDQLRTIEIITGFPREWIESGIGARITSRLEESLTEAMAKIQKGEGPKKRRR